MTTNFDNVFLKHCNNLFKRYQILLPLQENLYKAYEIICQSFLGDKTLFLCGNGGSAADCEHIAGELLKGFLQSRGLDQTRKDELMNVNKDTEKGKFLTENLQSGLKAISLTSHPSLHTAITNDTCAELGFAQQLNALGRKGDVLLAISTSGNAENVIFASHVGRSLGIKVIGLTGESGGKLADYCDVLLNVPEKETFKVQELHLPVYHTLCAMIEEKIFS